MRANNSDLLRGGYIYTNVCVLSVRKLIVFKPSGQMINKFASSSTIWAAVPEEQVEQRLNLIDARETDPGSVREWPKNRKGHIIDVWTPRYIMNLLLGRPTPIKKESTDSLIKSCDESFTYIGLHKAARKTIIGIFCLRFAPFFSFSFSMQISC